MDRNPHRARRVLVFTDIEASTPLAERLGDSAWLELLRAHNALVRAEAARHGGREVKFLGDGFLLSFLADAPALACAVGIQRAFVGWTTSGGPELKVRIGVHAGDVLELDGDLYGLEVALAARVGALARGGEVLVSGAVRGATAGALRGAFGPGSTALLRGSARAQELSPLLWWREGREAASERPLRDAVAIG